MDKGVILKKILKIKQKNNRLGKRRLKILNSVIIISTNSDKNKLF